MTRYLSYFLVLVTSGLYAQPKNQQISLKEMRLDISDASIYIQSVIDERQNKSNIGWVQKGIFNAKHLAEFEDPFETELVNFFNNSLPPSDEKIPIRIGVEHLHISELSKAFSEFAKLELTVIFYAKNDAQKWVPVGRVGDNGSLKGTDVTKLHPENIALTFEKVLAAFLATSWQSNINNPKNRYLTKKINYEDIPVYMADTHPSGIYRTFNEFLNNSPGIKDNYIARVEENRDIRLWTVNANGKKHNTKKDTYFGFAHEGKLYIKFNREYCEIEKRNDGFYFLGSPRPDANAVSTGAVVGGLLGAAIASSATMHQSLFKIDLLTGGVIEVEVIDK